jgi:phosphonate transport system permease protein
VLLTLLLVTTLCDLGANLVRRQLRVDPCHPRLRAAPTHRQATRRRAGVAAAVLAALLAALLLLWPELVRAAGELRRIEWSFAGEFLAGLAIPDLHPATLASVAWHALNPLALGVLATLLGALGAALLAYPGSIAFQLDAHRFTGERPGAATRAWRGLVLVAAKALALLLRGIPEVGWVVLLAVFFQTGITPCVIAVALHGAGVLQRVYAETIDNVPDAALERVGGASRPRIFLYGALPRAFADWRIYTFFQFEVNVRTGVALGLVGAGGLGHLFDINLDWRRFAAASSYLWAMVLLTALIDRCSRRLRLRRQRC